MAKIKISQLTAKGANLANTDLLPIAEVSGAAYVTKRVTGAQAAGGVTLTVGTTPIVSGTIGRVLFQGSGNVLQQSANLFWDNTNIALGLGASPATTSRLDIRAKDGLSTSQSFRIRNSTDTTTQFEVRGDGNTLITGNSNHAIQTTNGGITISRSSISFMDLINTSAGKSTYRIAGDSTNFSDAFYIRNMTAATFAYVQFSNGNTVIGSGGTIPTDAGFRLDINGTTRFQDNITISDAKNIVLSTTTGTKIGTATNQKISFWNVAPIEQPTTGVGSATVASAGAGNTIKTDDTFDGYTIAQVVKALRNLGILA